MEETSRDIVESPGKTFKEVAESLGSVSFELENQRKQQYVAMEALRTRQDITNNHLSRLRQSIGCIAWMSVIVPLVFLVLLVVNDVLEIPYLDAVTGFVTKLFGGKG